MGGGGFQKKVEYIESGTTILVFNKKQVKLNSQNNLVIRTLPGSHILTFVTETDSYICGYPSGHGPSVHQSVISCQRARRQETEKH